MKVTILGSSGQIGAYLFEYLKGKGHEVAQTQRFLFGLAQNTFLSFLELLVAMEERQ